MSWTSVCVIVAVPFYPKRKKLGGAGVTPLVRPPENQIVVGTRRELPRCCLRPGGVKIRYKRLNAGVSGGQTTSWTTIKITQRVLRFSSWSFGATRVAFSLAKMRVASVNSSFPAPNHTVYHIHNVQWEIWMRNNERKKKIIILRAENSQSISCTCLVTETQQQCRLQHFSA